MRASLRQELIYLKGLPSTSSAKISSETYEEVFSRYPKIRSSLFTTQGVAIRAWVSAPA